MRLDCARNQHIIPVSLGRHSINDVHYVSTTTQATIASTQQSTASSSEETKGNVHKDRKGAQNCKLSPPPPSSPLTLFGVLVSANSTVRVEQNGIGNISTADLEEGLRQLGVLDGMSREQARLATRRFDCNGDGTVSLPEFLAFTGRPYTANDRPLEAKLRRVLLKAESVRTYDRQTTSTAVLNVG